MQSCCGPHSFLAAPQAPTQPFWLDSKPTFQPLPFPTLPGYGSAGAGPGQAEAASQKRDCNLDQQQDVWVGMPSFGKPSAQCLNEIDGPPPTPPPVAVVVIKLE